MGERELVDPVREGNAGDDDPGADGALTAKTSGQQPLAGRVMWAPVRTCCVLAGFKMLRGLRRLWREGGAGDAGALQASGLGVSLSAVALALDQNGLDVVQQAVQQG